MRIDAPVAQLDRAIGFEPIGRGFESLRARQNVPRTIHSRLAELLGYDDTTLARAVASGCWS